MADHEFIVTKLSVNIASTGVGSARKMTATINFTKAGQTFSVILPGMLHDEVRHFVAQFARDISPEPYPAILAGSGNFTTALIT